MLFRRKKPLNVISLKKDIVWCLINKGHTPIILIDGKETVIQVENEYSLEVRNT